MLSTHHVSLYSDSLLPWPWMAAIVMGVGAALAELISRASDAFSVE
jgi:hypothetical protein